MKGRKFLHLPPRTVLQHGWDRLPGSEPSSTLFCSTTFLLIGSVLEEHFSFSSQFRFSAIASASLNGITISSLSGVQLFQCLIRVRFLSDFYFLPSISSSLLSVCNQADDPETSVITYQDMTLLAHLEKGAQEGRERTKRKREEVECHL